jgi:hypothetical protein
LCVDRLHRILSGFRIVPAQAAENENYLPTARNCFGGCGRSRAGPAATLTPSGQEVPVRARSSPFGTVASVRKHPPKYSLPEAQKGTGNATKGSKNGCARAPSRSAPEVQVGSGSEGHSQRRTRRCVVSFLSFPSWFLQFWHCF